MAATGTMTSGVPSRIRAVSTARSLRLRSFAPADDLTGALFVSLASQAFQILDGEDQLRLVKKIVNKIALPTLSKKPSLLPSVVSVCARS